MDYIKNLNIGQNLETANGIAKVKSIIFPSRFRCGLIDVELGGKQASFTYSLRAEVSYLINRINNRTWTITP